jgi:Chaperone of endosialidase
MAAIFQIRRGTSNITIADGELYVHQGSGSLQFGSGSRAITLLPLEVPVRGDINLIGNISASNAYITGDLAVSGNLFLGNQSSDNINVLGVFTTNLNPGTTNTYNVGSTASVWANVYANNISASSFTGSFSGSVNGINLSAFIQNINNETASIENRFTTLAIETASIENRFTTIASVTQSYNLVTASLNAYTSSTNGRLNNIESITSSNISRLNNLEAYTSSLLTAITASGANLTINGNLTVKGTTTTVNSTQVQLSSSILTLDAGGTVNGGIYVNDVVGTTATGSLLWNVTNNYWMAGVSGSEQQLLVVGGMNVISSSTQITNLGYTLTSSFNQYTASISTASIEARFTTLQTLTASYSSSIGQINAETASIEARLLTLASVTGALNTETASIEARFSTLQTLTASYSSSITQINAETASIEARFTTLASVTGALNTFTGSTYVTFSSSTATRLSAVEYTASILTPSGAVQQFAGLNAFTASAQSQLTALGNLTASYNQFTASNSLTSLNTFSQSVLGHIADINSHTGSYLTLATLPTGVVSGSSQVSYLGLSNIPAGIISGSSQLLGGSGLISSSAQIIADLPTGTVSGSSQILGGTGIVSGAAQVTPLLPTGVISGSSQILGGSGLFSSSAQVGNYVATITGTTNQISVAGSGVTNAAITLSTPQDIATTSNVTFNNITASAGIRAVGDIVAYYSSDERLKENITPIENALSKVELISGNTYDWKEGFDNIHPHKGNDVGVIAQEVEKVLPQVVIERNNGYKAVDYEKIVPLLIEAIKELSAKVKELESK